VTIAYDAGALIAADRDDRRIWADHRIRLELGIVPVTTAPVVARVSRSGQQVQLRRFLRGCAVVPFGADQAHEVGALMGRAHTSDVVDAHLAITAAATSSAVLTSDPDDLRRLSNQLSPPVLIRALAD
jgi:predicted nucleic acid-binding protein